MKYQNVIYIYKKYVYNWFDIYIYKINNIFTKSSNDLFGCMSIYYQIITKQTRENGGVMRIMNSSVKYERVELEIAIPWNALKFLSSSSSRTQGLPATTRDPIRKSTLLNKLIFPGVRRIFNYSRTSIIRTNWETNPFG